MGARICTDRLQIFGEDNNSFVDFQIVRPYGNSGEPGKLMLCISDGSKHLGAYVEYRDLLNLCEELIKNKTIATFEKTGGKSNNVESTRYVEVDKSGIKVSPREIGNSDRLTPKGITPDKSRKSSVGFVPKAVNRLVKETRK